jgi:hypothetical protein
VHVELSGQWEFGGLHYAYDEYGNRWKQTLTAGTGFNTSLVFGINNHLTPTNCTMGAGNFCYDGAGNLEYDGAGGNWAHDAEGHTFADETSSTTASYTSPRSMRSRGAPALHLALYVAHFRRDQEKRTGFFGPVRVAQCVRPTKSA